MHLCTLLSAPVSSSRVNDTGVVIITWCVCRLQKAPVINLHIGLLIAAHFLMESKTEEIKRKLWNITFFLGGHLPNSQ